MKRLLLTLSLVFLASAAPAVMDVPSQGWDGALNITTNTTIDLSQAMTGTWNAQPAGYVAGRGIYDPAKWAVVFHYTSVTIATGVTLKFTNHGANAPVVWLVEGPVQINGTLNVAGTMGSNGESDAGPGGFRGGRYGILPALPGGGFGPGGGYPGTTATVNYSGSGGGYGSAGSGTTAAPGGSVYGNAAIVPLIGGSGGGGRYNNANAGGGGGGAILLTAQTSIVLNGFIDARGGGGGYGGPGSGGAIRLITPSISGTGTLNATGGSSGTYSGGVGRIRIEAAQQSLGSLGITPPASIVDPGDVPQFWPDAATPSVRVVSLNGVVVPADPRASLSYPSQDTYLSGSGNVTAVLEAANVPTNATLEVFIVKQGGARTLLPSGSVTLTGGNTTLSTWQAVFPSVPNGMFAIQARAVLP